MTFLMYILYASIVVFIAFAVVEYLRSKLVELKPVDREKYSHFAKDLAPMVSGSGGDYGVVLRDFTDSKQLELMKSIRRVTHLGLEDAKMLLESTPVVLIKEISLSEAQDIKDVLEKSGAKVEINQIKIGEDI